MDITPFKMFAGCLAGLFVFGIELQILRILVLKGIIKVKDD